MIYRRKLVLYTILMLAAAMVRADMCIVAVGTVGSNTLLSGPLVGAQPGDPAETRFNVSNPNPLGEYWSYSVEESSFRLQVGDVTLYGCEASPLLFVMNDFGQTGDGLFLTDVTIETGYLFHEHFYDSSASVFTSPDLTLCVGSYPAEDFDSSYWCVEECWYARLVLDLEILYIGPPGVLHSSSWAALKASFR